MTKKDNPGVEFKGSLQKVPFSFISGFFFIFFFLEVISSYNLYTVCRYFDKKQEEKETPLVRPTKVAVEQKQDRHISVHNFTQGMSTCWMVQMQQPLIPHRWIKTYWLLVHELSLLPRYVDPTCSWNFWTSS